MQRVTLQELIEMFQSLPENVRSKEISYLDLAHMEAEDLEMLKQRLIETEDDTIAECQN